MSLENAAPAMTTLLAILDLERLEQNLFRGRSPQDGWPRVYGGQVLGQALAAAACSHGTAVWSRVSPRKG